MIFNLILIFFFICLCLGFSNIFKLMWFISIIACRFLFKIIFNPMRIIPPLLCLDFSNIVVHHLMYVDFSKMNFNLIRIITPFIAFGFYIYIYIYKKKIKLMLFIALDTFEFIFNPKWIIPLFVMLWILIVLSSCLFLYFKNIFEKN